MELQANYAASPNPLLLWVNQDIDPIEGYHFLPREVEREEIPAYNPTQVNIDTFLDFTENDGENVWCASVKRFFSVAFDRYGWSIYNGRDKVEGAFFPPGMDFTARKKAVQEAFTRFYASDV